MQAIKNILFNWTHISGFRKRNITHNAKKFVLTEYNIQASAKLKNKTIVFLSDTHFRELQFPYPELADFINSLKPDWIIFGGDLVRYMSYCETAIEFLSKLTAKVANFQFWETTKQERQNGLLMDSGTKSIKNQGFNFCLTQLAIFHQYTL